MNVKFKFLIFFTQSHKPVPGGWRKAVLEKINLSLVPLTAEQKKLHVLKTEAGIKCLDAFNISSYGHVTSRSLFR